MNDQNNPQNPSPQVPNEPTTPGVDAEEQKVLDELKNLKMQETIEMKNDTEVIDKKQIELKGIKIEQKDFSPSK